jgi:hypothetical protein
MVMQGCLKGSALNLPENSTPDFQVCKLGEQKAITEKPDK